MSPQRQSAHTYHLFDDVRRVLISQTFVSVSPRKSPSKIIILGFAFDIVYSLKSITFCRLVDVQLVLDTRQQQFLRGTQRLFSLKYIFGEANIY